MKATNDPEEIQRRQKLIEEAKKLMSALGHTHARSDWSTSGKWEIL